jgi:hypothetical protein
LQHVLSPKDLGLTESAENISAVNTVRDPLNGTMDPSHLVKVKPPVNATESQLLQANVKTKKQTVDEGETTGVEPKNTHPLTFLGKDMSDDRPTYLKRLYTQEEARKKVLCFPKDKAVPVTVISVSVNQEEADFSNFQNQIASGDQPPPTELIPEDIKPKVDNEHPVDNILFDYPLITYPCVSADNNLLAVYNIAQLKSQLLKLEGVEFLKSVYHSYPDKLLDATKLNQDTSLSSLMILGKFQNETRLLCLQKDAWSDVKSTVHPLRGKLDENVEYSKARKVTLLKNKNG